MSIKRIAILFSFLALTILLILLLTTGCVLESLEAAVLYLMLKTPLFLWRYLWSKSLVVHLGCSEWLWELSCQLKPHGRQKRNLLFSLEHYEAVMTECSVLCTVNGLCILFFQPLLIGIIKVGVEIRGYSILGYISVDGNEFVSMLRLVWRFICLIVMLGCIPAETEEILGICIILLTFFSPLFLYKVVPNFSISLCTHETQNPWTNFTGPSKFKYIETITQMSSDGATWWLRGATPLKFLKKNNIFLENNLSNLIIFK